MARRMDSSLSFYERSTKRSSTAFPGLSAQSRLTLVDPGIEELSCDASEVTSADVLANSDDTPAPVMFKEEQSVDVEEPDTPVRLHAGFAEKRRIRKGATPPRIATNFEITE